MLGLKTSKILPKKYHYLSVYLVLKVSCTSSFSIFKITSELSFKSVLQMGKLELRDTEELVWTKIQI